MARFNTKRETLQRGRERKGYVVSPKKENERVLEREAVLVVPAFTHVCGSSDCAGCVWPWMMGWPGSWLPTSALCPALAYGEQCSVGYRDFKEIYLHG